ncbi:MAG TPA: hypothetical protein VGR06_08815 [Actinophytocola sp.]|uniref:hypothetical protein n=1 Tax=Actinophytocola sp. TaxID=1872138 RepID=UPI002DF9C955|nr:hypothetical protein [Actinophytocola sp.]
MKASFLTLSVRNASFVAQPRSHWSTSRHHSPISNSNHLDDLETAVARADRAARGQAVVAVMRLTSVGCFSTLVTFIEMNGVAGPGQYDQRIVVDRIGMSYIPAPIG